MHLEYRAYLSKIVEGGEPARLLGLAGLERAQAVLRCSIDAAAVDDCPSEDYGSVTSNLGFIAAKRLVREFGADREQLPGPEAVARAVVQAAPADARRFFFMEVGGGGYLNAVPAPGFVSAFMAGAIKTGGEALFFPYSFVIEESAAARQDSAGVRLRHDRLCAEARKSGNPDAVELAGRGTEGSMNKEDAFMLLCLLDDSELDSRAYLLGIGGSENVPWQLRRFLEETTQYVRSYSSCYSLPAPEPLIWGKESGAEAGKRLEQFAAAPAEEAVRCVLAFRRIYLNAALGIRPERLAGAVRALMRSFYRYYHDPRARNVERLGSAAGGKLALLAPLLGAAAARAYELIAVEPAAEDW